MLDKPFKRQAFFIANAVFVCLWLVYSITLFNHPYIGIDLENQGGIWIVTLCDPQGAGFRAGVRVGDQIVKIDGVNTDTFSGVRKWGVAEGASTFEIRSKIGSVSLVTIPKPPLWLTLINEFPIMILGLSFWIIGLVTWLKRPVLPQARYLFLLNWLTGLAFILAPASSRQVTFSRELEAISFSLVSPALVKFLSIFPVERRTRINLLGLPVMIVTSAAVFITLALKSTGLFTITIELRYLLLAEALLGTVIALWNVSSLVRASISQPAKNQGMIVLTGLALGLFPFIILTALPILVFGNPILNPRITVLFTAIIPATWSFVIVNKYLPDGRAMFESVIKFIVTSTLASIILLLIVVVLGILSLNPETYLLIYSGVLLLRGLEGFLNRLAKKTVKILSTHNNHGFEQKMSELNRSLSSINEDLILQEMVKELELQSVFVVAEDNKGWSYRKAAGKIRDNLNAQDTLQTFFYSDKASKSSAVLLPDSLPAEVYIPISLENLVYGIFIGHRNSYIKFRQDELSRLTSLCYQVAQRLEAIYSIKKLSKEISLLAKDLLELSQRSQGLFFLNKLLVTNIEAEKKALAREIHDGPAQLSLDIIRRLKFLNEHCLDRPQVLELIASLQNIAENLDYELRSVCSQIRPSLLSDFGLITAVESMCTEVMQRELLVISMNFDKFPRDQRLKEDIELACFRFLQEGITNVVKHSGADTAEVSVSLSVDTVELCVVDNGRGFDVNDVNEWSGMGNHFGLIGMRERITGLGGTFKIDTAPAKGVILRASIPITRKGVFTWMRKFPSSKC